jgi:hypothetical protein
MKVLTALLAILALGSFVPGHSLAFDGSSAKQVRLLSPAFRPLSRSIRPALQYAACKTSGPCWDEEDCCRGYYCQINDYGTKMETRKCRKQP